MNTKYFLLVVLLLLPSIASAKYDTTTKSHLMQKADKEYQLGNYDTARKIYFDIYVKDDDKASKEQMNKCKQCISLLADAAIAERYEQYSDAIAKYQTVMRLNPRDPKVPRLLTNCKVLLYAPLLQKAKGLYREGRYEDAKNKILEYSFQSGQTDLALSDSINSCINLIEKAHQAVQKKEYTQAIEHYNEILKINPTDSISTKAIHKINYLITKKGTEGTTHEIAKYWEWDGYDVQQSFRYHYSPKYQIGVSYMYKFEESRFSVGSMLAASIGLFKGLFKISQNVNVSISQNKGQDNNGNGNEVKKYDANALVLANVGFYISNGLSVETGVGVSYHQDRYDIPNVYNNPNTKWSPALRLGANGLIPLDGWDKFFISLGAGYTFLFTNNKYSSWDANIGIIWKI